MRRTTTGRRNAAVAGSTLALCLTVLLAGCGNGGGGDDGYLATGAAGPTPAGQRAGEAAPPPGDVTLVPLDGSPGGRRTPGRGRGAEGSEAGAPGMAHGTPEARSTAGTEGHGPAMGHGAGGTENSGGPDDSGGSGRPGGSERPGGSGDSGGADDTAERPSPRPSQPDRPAALTVGEPVRTPTDERWCEKVTLTLHNTGDRPVTSGTVTFATHIIGALGIDWSTVESTQELPAPITGGQRTEQTWTVCVDAWRVPLGMHIETQDIDVDWTSGH